MNPNIIHKNPTHSNDQKLLEWNGVMYLFIIGKGGKHDCTKCCFTPETCDGVRCMPKHRKDGKNGYYRQTIKTVTHDDNTKTYII
jgi:hypothetical protein